jgi:hypothetical protein
MSTSHFGLIVHNTLFGSDFYPRMECFHEIETGRISVGEGQTTITPTITVVSCHGVPRRVEIYTGDASKIEKEGFDNQFVP